MSLGSNSKNLPARIFLAQVLFISSSCTLIHEQSSRGSSDFPKHLQFSWLNVSNLETCLEKNECLLRVHFMFDLSIGFISLKNIIFIQSNPTFFIADDLRYRYDKADYKWNIFNMNTLPFGRLQYVLTVKIGKLKSQSFSAYIFLINSLGLLTT